MHRWKPSARKAVAVAVLATGLIVAPLATPAAQATRCEDGLGGAGCAVLLRALSTTCKVVKVGCVP